MLIQSLVTQLTKVPKLHLLSPSLIAHHNGPLVASRFGLLSGDSSRRALTIVIFALSVNSSQSPHL